MITNTTLNQTSLSSDVFSSQSLVVANILTAVPTEEQDHGYLPTHVFGMVLRVKIHTCFEDGATLSVKGLAQRRTSDRTPTAVREKIGAKRRALFVVMSSISDIFAHFFIPNLKSL